LWAGCESAGEVFFVREQSSKSKEQRAKSKEQRAKSKEQRAKSKVGIPYGDEYRKVLNPSLKAIQSLNFELWSLVFAI
jgi:hypothetical protein